MILPYCEIAVHVSCRALLISGVSLGCSVRLTPSVFSIPGTTLRPPFRLSLLRIAVTQIQGHMRSRASCLFSTHYVRFKRRQETRQARRIARCQGCKAERSTKHKPTGGGLASVKRHAKRSCCLSRGEKAISWEISPQFLPRNFLLSREDTSRRLLTECPAGSDLP